MNLIIEGIVGSQAYGLANVDSDIDKLGIFVAPLDDVLGLTKIKESICNTNPDCTYHEVGKYLKLALNANPTILELMYLEDWETWSEEAQLIYENRDAFLSNIIRDSYGGYAISQARKLNRGAVSGRYAKHARHCFRLLDQGKQLLETGTMDVKVKNPEFIMSVGEYPPDELITMFETEYVKFKNVKSILPDKPSYDVINQVLLAIRKDDLYVK